MPKKKVGILRGGAGEHYVTSVKEGGEILAYIIETLSDRWEACDIFIDRDDVWHMKSLPITPSDLGLRVDIVWNMAHPKFSKTLEDLSIPNVSPSAFSSTLMESREMLEEHMRSAGINMPKSIVFPIYQEDIDARPNGSSGRSPKETRLDSHQARQEYIEEKARQVFEKFGAPWIVRSFVTNSRMAVRVAKTFPELKSAIEEGVNLGTSILVEELIDGKVTAVHSVTGFRGDDVYTFPSIGFSPEQNQKLSNFSKNLHQHLGIKHYLKSDVVWHPKRGMYVTNISLSPDFRHGSHFDKSSKHVGAEMHHVLEHILEKTLDKNKM